MSYDNALWTHCTAFSFSFHSVVLGSIVLQWEFFLVFYEVLELPILAMTTMNTLLEWRTPCRRRTSVTNFVLIFLDFSSS